jgi:hypothetical protein
MQRTCKTPFEYDGIRRKAGETVDVKAADVQLLVGAGMIERKAEDPVPNFVSPSQASAWAGGYSTRQMTASGVASAASGGPTGADVTAVATAAATPSASAQQRSGRGYNHRNQRAS